MKRPDNLQPTGSTTRPRRRVGDAGEEAAGGDAHAALARTIRAAYIEERSAFESIRLGIEFVYEPPARWDGCPAITTDDGVVLEKASPSAWLKMAGALAAEGIPAAEYVRAQFAAIDAFDRRPPEPNQLLGDTCRRRWRRAQAVKPREIELALASQRGIARLRIGALRAGGIPADVAAANVLLDGSLELSPLFRYCLAQSIGGPRFRRVARRFEPAACVQFQHNARLYGKIWGDFLPRGFARTARRTYDQIYGDDHAREPYRGRRQ